MAADQPPSHGDVTALLRGWQSGDRDALDRLIPLVYGELRVMASRLTAREWRVSSIQTTGLVNEAYLRLVDQRAVDWQGRAHFFAIAAQVMRRVLLDEARRRGRAKRGGDAAQVPIDGLELSAPDRGSDPIDLIAVDRALRELEQLDPDQAKLVELRFFGGLTVEETADVLGISPTTVKREWASAKLWLYRSISGRRDSPE